MFNFITKYQFLFTFLLMVSTIITNSVADRVLAVKPDESTAGHCAEGYVVKDENGPFTYSGNTPICSVGVKAGSSVSTDENACTMLSSNGSNGCYEVSGLGTTSVTVTKVGSGNECKDISYVAFYACASVTPTPTPTIPVVSPTPTPTPTPTTTETPTLTPTPTQTQTQTQITPTVTVTPTPTTSVDSTSTPTPTVTPTGTDTVTPTLTPTPTQGSTNNNNTNGGGGGVGGTDVSTPGSDSGDPVEDGDVLGVGGGDILGTSTLASTGAGTTTLAWYAIAVGNLLVALSLYGSKKTHPSLAKK